MTELPAAPGDDATQRQWLVDRALIVETVYLYATAVDGRDWELYRSIFTDVVDVDFSSFFGAAETEWTTMPADDWVRAASRPFAVLGATQHSMSNPRVTVEGDTASCAMYVQAEHFRTVDGTPRSYTAGGNYTFGLERTPAGWQLRRVRLAITWERGDKRIMTP